MSDRGNIPIRDLPAPPTITPCSRLSIGAGIRATGGSVTPVSGTNPFAANDMLAFPFVLSSPTNINKAFWLNGSSAGSNWAAAIYDADFNKLIQCASTAGSGASVPQSVAMAVKLRAGLYYCALATDSATTNRIFRWPLTPAYFAKMLGCWKQASVTLATLPNPATPAAWTAALLPVFGVTTRTVFDV